jgi:hypothetical protein
MRSSDVAASKGVKTRLGATLGEVCGWLWPKDCQTCGRALADQQPALCADNHGAFAIASLHHPECRGAEWNDSASIALSDDGLPEAL